MKGEIELSSSLASDVREIIDSGVYSASASVNQIATMTYWRIGRRIVEEIKRRVQEGVTFKSYDTICRSVANRIPQIREFAARHELILFVSGAKSSNGRILFAECKDANPESHLISSENDIDPSWLEGKERIGICGATSTPRWLMQRVSDTVQQLTIKETKP